METSPKIETLLKTLPQASGVYRFFDKDGTIIYVGKAKNLKKRVSSYFNKEPNSRKLKVLISNISDIAHTVVDNQWEALLLENNLIKKYRPKYNILLKDDKTYPWICITNEPFPRLFPTRKKNVPQARYFGPYSSGKILHSLLDTLQELFLLRTCKLNLSQEAIEKNKYRPCLDFQIKKCLAPCIKNQSEADYQKNIARVVNILQGKTGLVINELKHQMMDCADKMAFEQAHLIKEKVLLLEDYQARSTVVSETLNDLEVFAIVEDAYAAYLCYFNIVQGAIVQTQNYLLKQALDETLEDLLLYAIVDIREQNNSKAKEIIVSHPINYELKDVKVNVAKSGDKLKVLKLALHNASTFMIETNKQKELSNPELHRRELLEKMQKDLALPRPPAYIECFDNSNIQGQYAVSAMVCFRNGKPSKSEYRIFNVRSVDKPDDFSTMAEALTRRYSALLEEKKPLPDLVVVDGGKGQVSAAYKVLIELGLETKIPLLGIAKRLEEIYRPNDSFPLFVDKKSETQRIIQHLRDEAHRFGITRHRKNREKAMIKTELTNIQGIGDLLAVKLLSTFKSVRVIKNAAIEDLEKVIGKAKAKTVWLYFHTEKGDQ